MEESAYELLRENWTGYLPHRATLSLIQQLLDGCCEECSWKMKAELRRRMEPQGATEQRVPDATQTYLPGAPCPNGCVGRLTKGGTFPRLLAGTHTNAGEIDARAGVVCPDCGGKWEIAGKERE